MRLTGSFLRSTGQIVGGEGTLAWLTVRCPCHLCSTGEYVAVNEPHHCQTDPTGYEDVPPEERPLWRHFHAGNLEAVGGKPRAADYP